MTIINFQRVFRKHTLKGTCSICLKKRTRTIEECQTINPFNKNEDGTVKNYSEVMQSVSERINSRMERFNEEGFVCKSCKPYLSY